MEVGSKKVGVGWFSGLLALIFIVWGSGFLPVPGYRDEGFPRLNLGESIFFISLVLLSAFVLLGSPLFEVREIVVEGNNLLTVERIIEVSGIVTGNNIFKLKLAEAESRLRLLPVIKAVEIKRDLPSRIIIRVEERCPVALVPVSDGFIEVDSEGVYLGRGKLGEKGLPLITGVSVSLPPPGQAIKSKDLNIALKVINNLPPSLLGNLSEVNLDAKGRVVIYTIDGVQCRLGWPEDLERKGAILIQVLNELKDKEIEYIDLSFTASPVVKYVRKG